MEPPSYEEATLHPSGPGNPSTPPPTYVEAVTTQPDSFPVLTLPTAGTSRSQNTGLITHQLTQIGASDRRRQPQPTVVVTQPQPVPVLITHLGDIPGLVSCPHCHHVVTSKVTYVPGNVAWCMCLLITLMGFICGCCLIPFGLRSLQDVHHSCPRCGKHLGIYKR
ncbi:lipopolysaccharide-induced tumor necrosis factor-alpha factor homolog isoform X3 [Etheostoma spectabile]|uniref:lipopolysaccharide-induced tumor necrosis factor-alpha factor homolog isoform X3 n=1 Tax=Etheostoma spectabile TaxID=54343 RepID=UPI0013AF1C5E|nr:lipopolysaccharide-induced tumor necrosis factor-alpha factor homolog isoform X3 [Etheostoma spectabile]